MPGGAQAGAAPPRLRLRASPGRGRVKGAGSAVAQPAAFPAAPPRLAPPGSENGAMEATGVLPFVRGVDLSGNDFKVSRPGGGPGSPPGCFFLSGPRRSPLPGPPASGPSATPDCKRGRVGLSQGSSPPPRTNPRGLCSVPAWEDRAGADVWARSHSRAWAGSPHPMSLSWCLGPAPTEE